MMLTVGVSQNPTASLRVVTGVPREGASFAVPAVLVVVGLTPRGFAIHFLGDVVWIEVVGRSHYLMTSKCARRAH